MNSRTKIALSAGVAGALALGIAGVAMADKGRGGHGMSGHHHRMGAHSHMRAFAERYDANKDGRVAQDEVDANRSQWHGEFDADKDGALTLQEFQGLWIKARHERIRSTSIGIRFPKSSRTWTATATAC
jgi:hypothetical protein